jgi:murein DD-endopeptidase MepM/ murein hydrolase activator NlpD
VRTGRRLLALFAPALMVGVLACGGPAGVDTGDGVPKDNGANAPTLAQPSASEGSTGSAFGAASATASPKLRVPKPVGKYVFPVDGNASYAHNVHHDYPAADIIANCGLTVRSVTDGVVLEVNRVDRWEKATNRGPDRGGLSISILGNDGVRYYGSHFAKITKGLSAGDEVAAGQEIGLIGRTGDAGACHLHFGLSPVCKGKNDWWIRRGEVWPAGYLDAWRKGDNKSPATEVDRWLKKHGCPSLDESGAS